MQRCTVYHTEEIDHDSSYVERKKAKRPDEIEPLELAKPGTGGRIAAGDCLADDAWRH